MANVHPVQAVFDGTVVIHPDRGREGEPLAQLGRVDGAGKQVMPLAPLVKRERIPLPAGRNVALGQKVLDDGTQVGGARFKVASLGGQLNLLHNLLSSIQ